MRRGIGGASGASGSSGAKGASARLLAVGLGLALSGAACDEPGVTDDGAGGRLASPLSPTAEAPVLAGVVHDRPTALAQAATPLVRVVPGVPLAPTTPPVSGDNLACEAARPLGERGATEVRADDGAVGRGCFEGQRTTRFFRVSVGPREIVDVRLVNARPEQHLTWLAATPGCEVAADHCYDGWTWNAHGVTIVNEGEQAATWIVTAVQLDDARTRTFDLTLARTALASHTTCATAAPVALGAHADLDLAGAGLGGANDVLGRVLYYRVEVPASSRVSARVESPDFMVQAFVARGCAFDASAMASEATNGGDEARTFTIAVGSNWGTDVAPFTLVVEAADVAPEASCATPVTLAEGSGATVDTEQGGSGPTQCWCLAPTRAVFAEVVVPAGATVDLVATVLGDTTSGARVDLIELDLACAPACGDNVAFGSAGGATLRLANTGGEDAVRHVLVSGQGGWGEDRRAPEVELAVRPATAP